MTGLAVVFALLSASTVAFSTSVQHHAAESAPPSVTGTWGLIRHLMRQPIWLMGQVLSTVALVFHALALHFGPIALVQPVIISAIVLAVPVRAAIARRLPSRRELGAVLLAAAGLAIFLVASAPSEGQPAGLGPLPLLLVLGFLCVAVAGIAWSRRVDDPTGRAFLLGSAAGILFALVAVLLKMSLKELDTHGAARLLTIWPSYLFVLAGLTGVMCNQLAYRSARLSSSMPVLNVVDCLVALLFGYVVFHEVPRHTPGVLLIEAVSLAAMLTGLWSLARDEAVVLATGGAHEAPMAAQGRGGS